MIDHMHLLRRRVEDVPSLSLRRRVIASLLAPLAAIPVAVHAAPNDVVLLWGRVTEGPEMVSGIAGVQGQGQVVSGRWTAREACTKVQSFLYMNLAGPVSAALDALGLDQPGTSDIRMPGCPDGDGRSGDMWLIYTSCAMIMGNDTQYLRWTVPPMASEPEMVAIDFSTGESVRVRLETTLETLETGDLTNFTFKGPKGTRLDTLKVSAGGTGFVDREFTSRFYDFSYEARIAMAGTIDLMANLGTIESEGNAWIVADAPGADVISIFYNNFRHHVLPSAGADTLMGGALLQMAGIASRGIPIQTTQTSSMSMSGIGMLASAAIGADSTSTSSIDRIMVLPGKASGACGPTMIPEGVQMTDLDEAMAAAQGAAAGSGAGPGGPEYEEAMKQVSEAMQQLTPEQRQMMEQLGLGGMTPGVPAANSAGQASGASEPGGGPSGGAMPSREELYSDDMAQMVQRHLQALGYDPGNLDGDVTTDTIIAISEFQADLGLKVTGEVSPQLAGVLSAEVDKRR
jgi:hypothetical protein